MCCDSPSPPQADPAIGQAALANSEIAKAQLEIGREQLAWNREQYAKNEPKVQALLDQQARASAQQFDISQEQTNIARRVSEQQELASKEQLGIGREQLDIARRVSEQQMRIAGTSEERASEQWGRYKALFAPIEDRMASEAMAEGSEAQQAAEADKARAATAAGYEAQRGVASRDLARMGVNPNSGKYSDFEMRAGNAQGADEAGASNAARTGARMRGIALRSGVAQFGRNMPQTGIAADSLALGAGTSASGAFNPAVGSFNSSVNSGGAASGAFNPAVAGYGASAGSAGMTASGMNAATMAANYGVNSAMPWFGGAVGANSSAGNLYLGQYGAQMQGWNAQNASDSSTMAGIGQIGGTIIGGMYGGPGGAMAGGKIGGAMGSMFAAKGGVISRRGIMRRGYAVGGMVAGPGTATSDSVPAVVDGQQPAALSNGEGVLNVPAVRIVGEDFVHRINQVGLMIKQIAQRGVAANAPQMQQPVAA
ncbi:MAG: hypothetical protein AABM33_05870 [Pseudomonadota bacterium]